MCQNYRQLYYQLNKDRLNSYRREWGRRNPEKEREYVRKSQRKYCKSPKNVYKIILANSVRRGMDVDISQEAFIKWYNQQEKVCHYCSIPESLVSVTIPTRRKVYRLTIDRKDNDKTYAEGNIVLACYWCNQVKNQILTEDEMLKVGQDVIRPKWEAACQK
jgi:hypothetical protein